MPSSLDLAEFKALVLQGVEKLARDTVGDVISSARSDALRFVESSAPLLREWSIDLGRGELTEAQFEDLVKGESQLATLTALTQLGLAKTKLERFRTGLIDLVVRSSFKALTP